MKAAPSDGRERATRGSLHSLKGPLLIFLVALFFYFLAANLEEAPPGQLGPAFWPKTILLLLMVSCGIKAGEVLFSRPEESDPQGGGLLPAVHLPKLIALMALVIGVVAAMDKIGFPLSTILFLLLFLRLTGVRRIPYLLLISLGGTLFLLFLFVKVVYLPLPKGIWFFNDMTIYLYRLLRII
jgi:putative tricarboxylic transport membrane protein